MYNRFWSIISGITGVLCLCATLVSAQTTPFEKSGGKACATYFEAIDFFKQLAQKSPFIKITEQGQTDAGYPLHLITVNTKSDHNMANWHKNGQVVVLINNSIHPGEPDGTDASMLWLRDLVAGKQKLPANISLAIIPVYNIGGALNRGPYSRVNQNGPLEYGFRGNAQYLDLNRDFTKTDSRNAAAFISIFQAVKPHILIDNHVSDGADFQHTMTLLTTQYDKLGEPLGSWLRSSFEPAVYTDMKKRGWDLFPYVNFGNYRSDRGMVQYYEPPRYSSGYAALFQCIGFVPETHMLKPFADRVKSTYDLMVSITHLAAQKADSLKKMQLETRKQMLASASLALDWEADTSRFTPMLFKGYTADSSLSEVTGLKRLYYDHNRPFTDTMKFFNYYKAKGKTKVPTSYVVPAGWHRVADRLKLNGVQMRALTKDTTIEVTYYKVEKYQAATRPYESHYRYSNVSFSTHKGYVKMLKGDWLVPVNQPAKRFIVEMLEPAGPDSYFSWNFFDAILQQKEGYSNYRWEDVAAEWLKTQPQVRQELEALKQKDAEFAKSSNRILQWVYQKSPYFEPGYQRYPIYRIE
ncbi:MAG: hypothetical protein MUF24_07110 [Chitinophagaceae bacterium]|nr:hypothetical protein [Chitinophagaceae bacterium]